MTFIEEAQARITDHFTADARPIVWGMTETESTVVYGRFDMGYDEISELVVAAINRGMRRYAAAMRVGDEVLLVITDPDEGDARFTAAITPGILGRFTLGDWVEAPEPDDLDMCTLCGARDDDTHRVVGDWCVGCLVSLPGALGLAYVGGLVAQVMAQGKWSLYLSPASADAQQEAEDAAQWLLTIANRVHGSDVLDEAVQTLRRKRRRRSRNAN